VFLLLSWLPADLYPMYLPGHRTEAATWSGEKRRVSVVLKCSNERSNLLWEEKSFWLLCTRTMVWWSAVMGKAYCKSSKRSTKLWRGQDTPSPMFVKLHWFRQEDISLGWKKTVYWISIWQCGRWITSSTFYWVNINLQQ